MTAPRDSREIAREIGARFCHTDGSALVDDIAAAIDAAREEERKLCSRFWSKVRITDGCWEWAGSRQGKYGYLHLGGHTERRPARAHRLSWEMHHGPIADGLWVLHKCDNPPCVRPDHLFLGDRRDNMLDAASKGRICTIGKSRQTHCIRGHEFTEENIYRNAKGHRKCRACVKAANFARIRARGGKAET